MLCLYLGKLDISSQIHDGQLNVRKSCLCSYEKVFKTGRWN